MSASLALKPRSLPVARRFRPARLALYAVLLATSILWVFPLLWALVSSFKPSQEIIENPLNLLPKAWTIAHYVEVWKAAPFGTFFVNSMVVSSVSTVFIVATSLGAAYAFAKFEFRGKELFFVLVLATLLIPMETYIIPLFLTIKQLGWVNQMAGLIYPTIIMSSGIFFLRQSISGIPDELLDAARIDGASEFRIVGSVVLPLSIAPIAAVSILNWVATWSLFMWPLVVASSDQLFTMEVGLMYFQRQHSIDYGPTMAATVMAMLPIIAVFLVFRTRIMEGIAWTGSKG